MKLTWLDGLKKTWLQSLQANKTPQAVLINGVNKSGHIDFAKWLAQSLICQNVACGQCSMCKLIEDEQHPLVKIIRPEEGSKVIKVSGKKSMQILELGQFMSYRDDNWRIAIICYADQMNDYAANALLKNLEEPANKQIYILLNRRFDSILPTIVSRCIRLTIPQVPTQELDSDVHDLMRHYLSQHPMEKQHIKNYQHFVERLADLIERLIEQKTHALTVVKEVEKWPFELVVQCLNNWVEQAIYENNQHPIYQKIQKIDQQHLWFLWRDLLKIQNIQNSSIDLVKCLEDIFLIIGLLPRSKKYPHFVFA